MREKKEKKTKKKLLAKYEELESPTEFRKM